MNQREQLELENYLREFQPRAPRALPIGGESPNWRRLAAAIVLFIAGSIAIGSLRPRMVPPRANLSPVPAEAARESTNVLTRLALDDPREFSARMDRQSSRTLQHFDGDGLRLTASESWKKETAE